ncbi:hypothetical protein CDOO_02680 [Corynebacterium doosanense CAU 212 = DSM 45436]|uniref:Uncharacterized protein n=1 Tax=Corynebacterium doosanense CAU 212 = DSM 45436 TaxID=558173 RepID=A0A097IJ79_9CORY|nr:hypothetical protein CDOO_02680 [Corynebacterium doosanense CAU 212 = DSM 45436]
MKWAGLALRERPGKWLWLVFVLAFLLRMPWGADVLLSNLTDQGEGWPEELGLIVALLFLMLLLPMISLAVVRIHESAARQLKRDGLVARVPHASRVTGFGWLCTFSVAVVLTVALIPVLIPEVARRTFCYTHTWSRDIDTRCGDNFNYVVEPRDQMIAMVVVSVVVPLVGYLIYGVMIEDRNLKRSAANALQLGVRNYRWTAATQAVVMVVTVVAFVLYRLLEWGVDSAQDNLLEAVHRSNLGWDLTMFASGFVGYSLAFAVGLGIPILFAALIWAHLSYQAGIFDRFRGPSTQISAGNPLQNLGYQRQAPNGYRSSPFG